MMPSNTASIMDLHPKDRPFPFFDLPRELRDLVYEYALVERQLVRRISDVEDGSCTFLRHGPQASAFLVSKAFREEYEELAAEKASIFTPLFPRGRDTRDDRAYELEPEGFAFDVLKIEARLYYDLFVGELANTQEELTSDEHYVYWFMRKKFQWSASLILQIVCTLEDEFFHDLKDASQSEEIGKLDFDCFFLGLKNLERLEVYSCKEIEDIWESDHIEQKHLARVWTKKEGWRSISANTLVARVA